MTTLKELVGTVGPSTKTGYVFRVGDRVKLKQYTEFSDYLMHDRQTGVIDVIFDSARRPYHVVWDDAKFDGDTSSVAYDNLILCGVAQCDNE